ncbi:unnamed protein product [Acanthoscelides obtectus]|uniref:Uncharacterized protein n=1 Tax=Acanthoscelides obtectus TaxID=200917 RepID=A0A9P0QAK6_ACAOB|nr:unnamed protein product [Acanthoscelides obtectus]CAK1641262.1 hypothetical protein AOBTE_LOCUS12283 [Acanthoscelides obtectus]
MQYQCFIKTYSTPKRQQIFIKFFFIDTCEWQQRSQTVRIKYICKSNSRF